MAIAETDMDSLGLVTLSFGNQGLNPDLVVESGCISSNGTVDCTGETVQVCKTLTGRDGAQALATVALYHKASISAAIADDVALLCWEHNQ